MARSQVTGASLLPSFPQTLEGESILREPATANGPMVPPRQYFRHCGQRTRWLSYPTVQQDAECIDCYTNDVGARLSVP